MPDIEFELTPIEKKDGDFSDEGKPAENETDVKEKTEKALELIEGKAAATEGKNIGLKVEKGLSGLDQEENIANALNALRQMERTSNSRMGFELPRDVNDGLAPKVQEGQELERVQRRSIEEAERPTKQLFILRFKFWAFFLGLVVTTAGTLIAGGLAYWLTKQDGTAPPDLPDEVKKAIDRKIEQWKDMDLDAFFTKLGDFITLWTMSTVNQGYVVNQLMAAIPQPDGLANFTYAELVDLVDLLLEKYHAAPAPKSLILYSVVKTLTRANEKLPKSTRLLTKHEGLYVISTALAQINGFNKKAG